MKNWWMSIACVMALLVAMAAPMNALADEDGGDAPKKAKKEKKPKGEKAPKAKVDKGDKAKGDKAKGEKGNKGKADKGGRAPVYTVMANETGFSEAQKAELDKVVAARAEAIKAWEAANKDKLAELKEKAKKAKEAKDKDAMKEVSGEMKKLTDEKKKLEQEYAEKILGIMTAEQKIKWDGYTMWVGMMRRYSKMDLTEDQKAKIKALCVAAATDASGKDEKAQKAAASQVAKSVEDTILTDDQKAKLPQKKAKEPKEKKAKGEGKGKKKGGDEGDGADME